MSDNRSRSRRQSGMIAFCGLVAALSVAVMLSGGLIPIATYCVPMICGVFLLPVLLEFGRKTAWTTFAAVALISLLLGIDKEASFFYLFLGYYPIVKWSIERIKSKPLRVSIKLLVFNGSLLIMYALLGFLLNMDALIDEFTQMSAIMLILFVLMLNACMFLYDRLLGPMVYLYVNKLRPRLKFVLR